jgi:hypothetical protein
MPPKASEGGTVTVSQVNWDLVMALLRQKNTSDFDMHKAAEDLNIKTSACSMRWSRFQTKYSAELNPVSASGQATSSATTSKAAVTPKKKATQKGKGKGKKAAKEEGSDSDEDLDSDHKTQKVKGKKNAKKQDSDSEGDLEDFDQSEQAEQSDDEN